jgi:hypothetical protein
LLDFDGLVLDEHGRLIDAFIIRVVPISFLGGAKSNVLFAIAFIESSSALPPRWSMTLALRR